MLLILFNFFVGSELGWPLDGAKKTQTFAWLFEFDTTKKVSLGFGWHKNLNESWSMLDGKVQDAIRSRSEF